MDIHTHTHTLCIYNYISNKSYSSKAVATKDSCIETAQHILSAVFYAKPSGGNFAGSPPLSPTFAEAMFDQEYDE